RGMVRGDQLVITRMQPVQHSEIAGHEMVARGTERSATDMRDEYAAGRDMPPAEMARAKAEIVLLAVALREYILAEQADGLQTVVADVHAEPDGRRNVDHQPGIGAVRQRGEPAGGGQIRNRVAAR